MKRSTSASFDRSSKQLKTGNDTFQTSPIAKFRIGIDGIICSALNHERNLILIYSGSGTNRGVAHSGIFFGESSIDIFTLDGDLVTKIIIGDTTDSRLVTGQARFTDHMIMICDKWFKPIILTDFAPKFPFSPHKTLFIEFDEKGDIYTNGERNKIVVYSQNLEFKEVFKIDLPNNSIITSLHIRYDTIVVLSYYIGHDTIYTIRRFVRSTRELVNYLKFAKYGQQRLNDICIDQFSNIIVSTANGICIWPKNGVLSCTILEGNGYIQILLTEDSQIILITRNGTIIVYRRIDIVSYLC